MCFCYELCIFRFNFIMRDELSAEGLLVILSWIDVSDGLSFPVGCQRTQRQVTGLALFGMGPGLLSASVLASLPSG